jgi:hypothetical protein
MRLSARNHSRAWITDDLLLQFKGSEIATVVAAHRGLRYGHWCLRLEWKGSLVCSCTTVQRVLREQDAGERPCD